ncbi:MAG: alginate export family protein, partial [Gammaproteobacteria bacterium]|nr:alginate export family protein [Gammaproteobacteria bacterium]
QWKGDVGRLFQAFYTLPVSRKPRTAAALIDNDIEFDEESDKVRFWGMFYRFAEPAGKRRLELYLLGLDEEDSADLATRNRELYTPGLRFWKPKERGGFDYLLESALQFGESRASANATRDLDHFAHYHHVEVGYSFATRYSPRVVLRYDYASGDDDPNDGDAGRFDTLFGARRFEYGPTGIYGPFARANLSTPGIRVDFEPARGVKVFADYRAFWLASGRDAWVAARVSDPAGASGRFVAQQLEARVRWDVMPGNLRFEAGAAHLVAGEFIDNAPNATGQGDATYLYSSLVFTF